MKFYDRFLRPTLLEIIDALVRVDPFTTRKKTAICEITMYSRMIPVE